MSCGVALNSFVNGTGVGALFSIQQQDWSALRSRVDVVIADAPLGAEIATILPVYPALLTDCRSWLTQTMPQLLALASGAAIFAGDAVSVLKTVSGELAGHTPDSPPPFLPIVELGALAQNAAGLATTAGGLAQPIATFVTDNRSADAELEQLVNPSWATIAGPLDALEIAMADVSAGWQPIQAELDRLAQGIQLPSTAEWLALDLAAAIEGWQALQRSAQQFVQSAAAAQVGST